MNNLNLIKKDFKLSKAQVRDHILSQEISNGSIRNRLLINCFIECINIFLTMESCKELKNNFNCQDQLIVSIAGTSSIFLVLPLLFLFTDRFTWPQIT